MTTIRRLACRAARPITKSRGSTIGYVGYYFFFLWWHLGFWQKGRKREFQLRAGVGFHVSMEEQSGILTCFMNWPTPTRKLPWLARFQVMCGHNSVACQVLWNVSIIVWLHMLVSTEWMKSSSPIVIIFIDFWHHYHSFFPSSDICWFPTFSTLPSLSWPPDPF